MTDSSPISVPASSCGAGRERQALPTHCPLQPPVPLSPFPCWPLAPCQTQVIVDGLWLLRGAELPPCFSSG